MNTLVVILTVVATGWDIVLLHMMMVSTVVWMMTMLVVVVLVVAGVLVGLRRLCLLLTMLMPELLARIAGHSTHVLMLHAKPRPYARDPPAFNDPSSLPALTPKPRTLSPKP